MNNQTTKSRRTLEDIDRFYSPNEVYDMIVKGKDVQTYVTPFIKLRNNALCSMAFLTMGRISEVLSLKWSQIKIDKNFIVISDMIVVKHRVNARTGSKIWRGIPIRPEVLLPRKGVLAPLTELMILYLQSFKESGKLFPFTRQWAWKIITTKSEKFWPHWFRAQGESYFAQIMGDDLAKYIKVDPKSIAPYRQPNMPKYRRELLK